MNLDLIKQSIADFKLHLKSEKLCEWDWLYYKQVQCQAENFVSRGDIEKWLQLLFSSDRTQRIWKRDSIRSSEVLNSLMLFDSDMVLTAFRELYAQERDLEGRIDRFKFYMGELIERKRRNSTTFHETWHHQDNAIISYYLTMKFPRDYTYYTPELHRKVITKFQAKPAGESEDPVRYQKMAKVAYCFLSEDAEFLELHYSRFQNPIVPESRLVVFELFSL